MTLHDETLSFRRGKICYLPRTQKLVNQMIFERNRHGGELYLQERLCIDFCKSYCCVIQKSFVPLHAVWY